MKVCISSGHGKYISGAVGPQPWGLHEHNEAVKVVNETAKALRDLGHSVSTFEDTTSRDQNTNLATIVNWHNAQGPHDLDVSIHFNSNGKTEGPLGHEVWYMTAGGKEFAADIVEQVCTASGLKSRGVKQSSGLYFLKHTEEIACLVETCFVTSHSDCDTYREQFSLICAAIAQGIVGEGSAPAPEPPPDEALFHAKGTMSTFGGPDDTGVSPSENLAWWEDQATAFREAPQLFLPTQPAGTTGLARRLNPWVPYLACRWDYSITPKSMLRSGTMALVRSLATGMVARAFPADWGPHEEETGRAADLSPGLADFLALETDDEVEVIYPAPGEE